MQLGFSYDYSIWIFIVSIILLWIFSNKLSNVVNFIDDEFNLGSSFGGTIILSIVTNLPEIAITVNGSLKGNIDLAIGNILGGIVIQSMLLVVFDFASRKEKVPLSSLVGNKSSILQGLFLIIILAFVILGKQLTEASLFFRSTGPELLIVFSWIISIILLRKTQAKKEQNCNQNKTIKPKQYTKKSAIIWLIIISIIVLTFGVLLEITSDKIANHFNINGVIFGATILAFVTSLPEISSGLAFVKERRYQPIISDIFGGNAFLPVLFAVATIITNDAILPKAQKLNIYLTATAILINTVYLIGMVLKIPTRKKGLGIDSWIVLAIYLLSLLGMAYLL